MFRGDRLPTKQFLELNSQRYWWADGNRCVGSFWISGCSDRLSDGWNVAGPLES